MRQTALGLFAALLVGAACFATQPAAATPITYVYKQTAASVSDFIVTGTMVVDGPLPTLNNQFNLGPYDFGGIVNLDLSLPGFSSISLSWFTAPDMFGNPSWFISGNTFLYHNSNGLDFRVGDGPIFENTDSAGGGSCFHTGVCTGEGHWEVLPEPATVGLFGSALVGLTAIGRRRKKSPQHP